MKYPIGFCCSSYRPQYLLVMRSIGGEEFQDRLCKRLLDHNNLQYVTDKYGHGLLE